MQDKGNQQFIDKHFVNSSWKDMKQMLDNDIPVTSDSSNKIITALLGLLLLSFFAISYLTYIHLIQIPTAELTKEKIIYKEIYIQSNNNFENEISTNTINQYNRTIRNTTQYTQGDVDLNASHQNILNISESNDLNVSSKQQNDFSLQNSSIDKLPSIDNTPMPSIDVAPVIFPFSNHDNSFETRDKKTQNNKIRYNLGILSFISNNLDYSGYGFTSGIQIPLSKRVGLQTGLAINFISREYFILPIISKNNQHTFTKAYGNLKDQKTYYDGLKSFKQIYLPVGINYNISNFFSLSSGVKFRYTYSEELDQVLKSRASRTLPKSQSVENAFFNNTYVGLSAGISYKVNKRLNFILDSEWGVNSIINKDRLKNSATNNYDLNLINLTTNFSF